jgi:hypothetical protein
VFRETLRRLEQPGAVRPIVYDSGVACIHQSWTPKERACKGSCGLARPAIVPGETRRPDAI